MNLKKFTLLILAFVIVALFGCSGKIPISLKSPQLLTTYTVSGNQTNSVRPGGAILITEKGDHFDLVELKNRIKSQSPYTHEFKCNLSPQIFYDIFEDSQYYYYISNKDRVNHFLYGNTYGHGLAGFSCGLRVSKADPKDVSSVCSSSRGGDYAFELFIVDGQAPPQLEITPTIDIYQPNFLRKTLKFDSFADGFLSLHYMEERGTKNGYDAQGTPVTVPPNVTERMFEFDLQTSKVIAVQGAKLEILDARPDKLVYKVVRQMSAE